MRMPRETRGKRALRSFSVSSQITVSPSLSPSNQRDESIFSHILRTGLRVYRFVPEVVPCARTEENMVVDMELEATKSAVLQLAKDKDSIEEELKALNDVLASNRVGMDDPLVDSEGYPRNDIDVYRVRHARHRIICLRNDHKAILKKIADGLIQIHAVTGGEKEQPVPAPSSFQEEGEAPITEPFLRVNLVSSGSPAELAGIKENDLIMEFGSVNFQNYKSIKDIGSLVEHSRYKPLIIKVKRDTESMSLTLIPRPWSGKGLLGCNVIPLEMVER